MPPGLTETKPARPKPLYRQLQPRWCGLDQDGVANHQRLRLIGAMIEVAGGEGGYASANIKLLSALAGVSRQTFYDRFGTTEACFLATYEYVVGRAARHVRAAYRAEGDWEAKLRAAFDAYASEVVSEPGAARLALVEILGGGPAALEERDRGRQAFEQMISSSLRAAPHAIELPPIVAKAIVGGVERITRLRLLGGGVEELPALTDELLAWAVSYSSPAVTELRSGRIAGDSGRTPARRCAPARSERTQMLRSAAQIAATAGYAHLTRSQILYQSGASEETFDELFESTEQCFLDALDLLGSEALASAIKASADVEDRRAAVREGIAALLAHVADNRVLQRIAFVEIFAVGPAGVKRRERLLEGCADLLVSTLPESQRPSKLVAQAIVGAVWAILHSHVTRGAASRLPGLADHVTYIALAPAIGAEAAVQAILAARVVDGDGEEPRANDSRDERSPARA